MLGLELLVVIGVTTLLSRVLARRIGVAQPLLLVGFGVLMGLVPLFRGVELAPEVVLFLFLPAILYWESLTTSLREIKSNLRSIILMSTGLVVFTAAAVAVLAHALGLPWGPAWVLGAAIAPTDATAVSSFTHSLPRRNVTILRAESLVNDGTALVLWSIAIGFTVGDADVSLGAVTVTFLFAYLAAAAIGALVAWAAILTRKRLRDAITQNIAMLLTPFTAYLIAELVHASGVLAVVVAGLIISQAGPRIGVAEGRRQSDAFWSFSTFLLNASLFVLVGIELPRSVGELATRDLGMGLVAIVGVTVVIVAARFVFQFATVFLIRLLDRRPEQKARRMSNRWRVVSSLSGFRGAVSLAAALAVPATVGSGQPFPGRDFIVFVTTGVIIVTLVVQGLLLPGAGPLGAPPVGRGGRARAAAGRDDCDAGGPRRVARAGAPPGRRPGGGRADPERVRGAPGAARGRGRVGGRRGGRRAQPPGHRAAARPSALQAGRGRASARRGRDRRHRAPGCAAPPRRGGGAAHWPGTGRVSGPVGGAIGVIGF